MLLGEVAALRALSLGHAPSHDKMLVGLALFVGMAVVVFPYLNNSKRYSTAVHTTVVVVAAAYVVGLVRGAQYPGSGERRAQRLIPRRSALTAWTPWWVTDVGFTIP